MVKPSRPYIVKALYDWLLDSELTPHLLVDATLQDVLVPEQFVQDGQIVLNIMPSAVRNLFMDDEAVSFNARFSGQPMDVYVPMKAILAIYAREDGQGMGFGAEPGVHCYHELQVDNASVSEVEKTEENEKVDEMSTDTQKPKAEKKRPTLKVVK